MFFWDMSQKSEHIAPAVVGSVASLGAAMWRGFTDLPTIAQVGVTPDNIPVFGAIVVGVMGIGWSIYSAGPDRARKTLIEEIGVLQDQVKRRDATIREQDIAIDSLRGERTKLQTEVGRLMGLLAKYEAQVLAATQPAPPPAPTPNPDAA